MQTGRVEGIDSINSFSLTLTIVGKNKQKCLNNHLGDFSNLKLFDVIEKLETNLNEYYRFDNITHGYFVEMTLLRLAAANGCTACLSVLLPGTLKQLLFSADRVPGTRRPPAGHRGTGPTDPRRETSRHHSPRCCWSRSTRLRAGAATGWETDGRTTRQRRSPRRR